MSFHRRTAPRVIQGRVQRKNRWRREPDYRETHQIQIERERAPRGTRHFVSPTDVAAFLPLLPEWRELSIGLQRVLLSRDRDCDGWYLPHTVALCVWPDGCVSTSSDEYVTEHAEVFRRLGVPTRPVVYREGLQCERCYSPVRSYSWDSCEVCGHSLVAVYPEPSGAADETLRHVVEFTPETLQAYLLIHVLVHELGHHHDRMTSPRQKETTRGEGYAEDYARRHEAALWAAYRRVFRV